MKKFAGYRAVAAAIVVACLACAVCIGVLRRVHAPLRSAERGLSPAQFLESIPRSAGTSETDRNIAEAVAKLKTEGADAERWVRLGDSLMQRVRDEGDIAGYDLADHAYREALRRDPADHAAMTGVAWVEGGRHQFTESIEWATRSIAIDANDNLAYGLIGDAHLELGDYATAFKDYQRMLDLRPDMSSYARSAHLLNLTGQNFRASVLMRQAIAAGSPTSENTAWCRAQLALIYFSDGNVVAAEGLLEDALLATPNNRHVLSAMGKMKAAGGDVPAAIAYYRRAVAIRPEHESLVALGDLFGLLGDRAEAEKQFEAVEQLHRSSHAASDTTHNFPMAQFYVDHDRNLVEALRLVEERKNTKNVFEADTLAWCYYKNGQWELARAAIKRALSQHTPDARMLFHAGMIHLKLDDEANGRLYISRALSLNPYFSPVFAPMAVQVLHDLGQTTSTAHDQVASEASLTAPGRRR